MNALIFPACCSVIACYCCYESWKHRDRESWAVFYSFTAMVVSALGIWSIFNPQGL